MQNNKLTPIDVIIYFFCCLLVVAMLYPVWYVLMFSLSSPDHISINGYYFLPSGFTLQTYKFVLQYRAVFIGLKNSVFVTLTSTFIGLMLTVMIAYPLSRNKLFGKKFISAFMLFTMLFNAGLIPTYLVVSELGLIDSLWALILPNVLNTTYILIMIKSFKSIPESLIESAKIEGYNDISILFRIVLPTSPAALASIGLFYAVWRWNEYLPGVMYINDTEKNVLQIVLRGMLNTEELGGQISESDKQVATQNMKMATVIVTMLPIVMVYPFLQKYFMKGVMLGSVKE